ncbi:MAG: FtsX-like permease family protein, partial [Terriglobales bacterium]
LSPAIVGFALLLAMLSLLVFAVAPALASTRLDLQPRVAARGRSGRAPHVLVAVEASLALALMLSAGLLLSSFIHLSTTSPGFQAQGRISFEVDIPALRCLRAPCGSAEAAVAPYMDHLLQRVRALPGVSSAAGINGLPLSDSNPGDFGPVPSRYQGVFPTSVTSGYFATMGIPLRRGRDFNAGDRMGTPKKLIVNQAFVDRYFPSHLVLGRIVNVPRCRKGFMGNVQNGCTIVGVVGNVRNESLAMTPAPEVFMDINQDPPLGYTIVIHTGRPSASVLADLRAVIDSLPPVQGQQMPLVFSPRTLGDTVAASIASPRFRTWLAALFAALGLGLAAVGIYGVESHAVSRRRHEIGVRAALGATRGDLRRWVLFAALRWTLLGIACGLPLAWLASGALRHFLYQVPRWDPLPLLGAPLLLVAVALLAAWRPARRATRVDPIEVLRAE